MQDALLRVVVVALGLLLCPRDDPGVQEEWDDIVTVGLQKHEETLLRGEEKLGEETAPVREKVKQTDDKGPPNKMKSVVKEQYQSDPHVSDKHTSVEKEVTVSKPDSEDYAGKHFTSQSDTSQPLKFRSESQISLTTSHAEREHQGNLLLDVRSKPEEDILTGGFFTDTVGPQGQQHMPDESPSEVNTQMSENETSEKTMPDWQEDYLWYILNTFSIISIIRFFRKYLRKNSMRQDESNTLSGTSITGEVPLPDSNTLQNFHSKYVKASSNNKWREGEFLEGFANDMVEAMRVVCKGDGGMVIEDCEMLDSCDIIVPFTPPEPYGFQCLLSNHQGSDLLPEMQVCGQIKLVEKKIQNACPCHSSGSDDVVCLLHCENEKVKTKTTDVCEHPLCLKNSPFLSKSLVTRWFQSTIKQAWAQISHKYDFELSICYIDAPGALVVRFRSGKKLCFSMNPVVKFNTDSHFYITPFSPSNLDTCWTLSLTIYEDHLLQCLSKHMPENPCHMQTVEIAWFLHQRQTAMSAGCLLTFSHFKTALFHMLLTKDPSQWKPSLVACRLRDLFDFMERSLENKLLYNVFIGNPATQKIMLLPAEFTQAKPVNLFSPLVVQNCIYRNTVMHFQEMLKNTQMLINDHVGVLTGQLERNSVLKT